MNISDCIRVSGNRRLILTLLAFAMVIAWGIWASVAAQVPGRGIIPGVPQAGGSLSGVAPAGAHLYALDVEQNLWFRAGCGGALVRIGQVRGVDGALIGIDFRPADGLLYGLSDRGQVYTLSTVFASPVNPSATVPFESGFQSLLAFNPVLDAVRLIATDDANFALVQNFTAFARQANITYAAGDVNAGRNAALVGGDYTASYRITPHRPAPATTLFYGIDFTTDSLVYIAPAAPGQSSATGGGQLQTIGPLQFFDGAPLNVLPLADMDIFTDAAGGDYLVGFSGRTLFGLDLSQVAIPPLGQSAPVRVRTATIQTAALIDIAVQLDSRGCN